MVLVAVCTLLCTPARPCAAAAQSDGRVVYVMVGEGSWLNIREKPKAHASVVMRLSRGDALTLYGIGAGGWAEVCRAGDSGYCRVEYLCDDPPGDAQRQCSAVPKLKVRATPGGKVLCRLGHGEEVTVRGRLTDDAGTVWANIGFGFLKGDCLEPIPEAEVP